MNVFTHLVSPTVVGLIVVIAQFFIQPLMQERVTSKSELWLQKRELYVRTMSLIDNKYDSLIFGNIKPISIAPTSQEMNEVYRELLLVSDDENVITEFGNFMDNSRTDYNSPYKRGEFIIRLRKDLGESIVSLKPDAIPYFRQPLNSSDG